MSDFIIRNATVGDAELLADFNVEMALETEHRALDKSVVWEGALNVINNPQNGFYLILEAHQTDVGALLVTFEWSDWRNGQFWWIQSVYIDPAWRGRGYFRALYEEVERRARSADGVCGLRLYVERDNLRAQGVYAKLGMEQTPYLIYETEF